MQFSIVISTYNRPESLSRCIEAVSRQKEIADAEIVIVDDGSDGDFKAIERNWKTKLDLRYIKIRHAGRAAARNRGARAAKGERILFLDDDIMVRPGWLQRHRESGGNEKFTAVLGPYPIEPLKKGRASAEQTRTKIFQRLADPVRFDLIKDPENAGFAFFVTGNLSMDRSLLNEIGGFDERFRHYGWEDIDLGYRFERAGGRLKFDEKARAIHAHRPMTRRDLWERERAVGITAYQFWSKWQNADVEFMKFWGEAPAPGPGWRRALGRVAVAALETAAPNSEMLARLYERLVFSYRHLGAAEGRRLYGDTMKQPAEPEHAEASP